MKQIAENFACSYPEGDKLGQRYVSNGVLSAAAIHAGFRTMSCVDDYGYDELNVSFNMSKPLLRVQLVQPICRVSHETKCRLVGEGVLTSGSTI